MAYVTKAIPKATALLEPGEKVVALARYQLKGVATAQAVGGLAGAAIQAARTRGDRNSAAAAGLTLRNRGTIAVTDRRVVVFSPSALGGYPKKLVDSVGPGTIVGAEPTGKGIAPMLTRICIHYANGGESQLDLFKRDGADELIQALTTFRGN